jgi:cell division protein FtsI (penicillin-binding protein 3)
MSIGQEISVTALQLVAAFGAVANGGVLMAPRLVRATFDADGREIRSVPPKAIRRVISEETARTLMRLMVQIVEHGTGHAAAIQGYDVGGKTGTAQKMDPATRRYSHAPGVLSFVGVAPADDPRFVMLVMLDEPKNEKWGSEAAAPVFASIGREVLRYLEVPARDAQPVQFVATERQREAAANARPFVERSEAAERAGEARQPASSNTARELASSTTAGEPATSITLMPDLQGKPLRQALAALAVLRADVELEGSGVVVQQIPAAGAPVVTDAAIRLTLARLGAGPGTGAGGQSPGARDFNNGQSPGARDFNNGQSPGTRDFNNGRSPGTRDFR